MAIKTLKGFQAEAIDSAMEVFQYAQKMLDAAGDDPQGRAVAIHENGYLLIEAPTGSGKTLMAGNIVERMSALDDVVWFWFAPFKGVVDQTAAFLREQFAGLRLRTLSEDRSPEGTRKGDVFVMTWQLVATRVKDSRSVRRTGELKPSTDELILALREQGMRIGVVIDEAHHGFHGDTQAAEFFRGVLKPEYTILVTATPDDEDLADLEKRMQTGRVQRISVSRADAVHAGLIKDGIKCVTWTAEEGNDAIIDFEAIAMREGASLHRLIKAELNKAGVSLAPLMLVQVSSSEKSVEKAKERLLELGFVESQIAIHTAAEPDANLLALANDESREVLIFKMAVALGFDAPRAWTLVSMRAARDPDFGVQLVGRILRVHRRLQGRNVPDFLRIGYVLLADAESQTGIDIAGQRMNALQTEYAKISPTTVVVRVGNRDQVQVLGPGGQISFLPAPPPPGAVWTPAATDETASTGAPGDHPGLFGEPLSGPGAVGAIAWLPIALGVPSPSAAYRYALRKDAPRRFKTQDLPPDMEVTEEQCAAKFVVSAANLLDMLTRKEHVQVQKRTLEIFTHMVQMELSFAPPSPEQMRLMAQRELFRSGVFHPKVLRTLLLNRLHVALVERGVEDAQDPDKLAGYLDALLAMRPELLREAQRAALLEGSVVEDAVDLPEEICSDTPLRVSRQNVYGVMPAGLNSWEREFGDLLDSDTSGTVLWWHRNPVFRPWSVRLLLADGHGFYPDFIVGIQNRKTEDNGLLADTKYAFEVSKELPKILASHASYGHALILSKNPSRQWTIVKFDEKANKAVLDRPFRVADAAGYD